MTVSSSLLPAAALLLLTGLAGCDTQRSVTSEASGPATLRATAVAPATAATAPTPAAATAVSFRKELTEGGLHFTVETTGKGSQRQLTLHTEQNGHAQTTNTQALNGTVTDAVVANLNGNQFPELLVFVSDAGSGSYGQLIGYEFESQTHKSLILPELSGGAADGYQGQDVFRVEGRTLLRSFPLYKPADPNCCPSGGTRTVRYTLPETGLTFQQAGVEDKAKQ